MSKKICFALFYNLWVNFYITNFLNTSGVTATQDPIGTRAPYFGVYVTSGGTTTLDFLYDNLFIDKESPGLEMEER